MRDMNPMDSAVKGQQQIFAPSPSLQVSRARCSCAQVLVPFYGGEAAVLQWGERVLSSESLIPRAASSSSSAVAGGTVCPWAGGAE